jgi:hypothetical protein
MTGEDACSSVFMHVPGRGAFVRALLPVRLERAHKLTFGVWIGVTPDELRRASDVWWEPEYVDLVLEGRLAREPEIAQDGVAERAAAITPPKAA